MQLEDELVGVPSQGMAQRRACRFSPGSQGSFGLPFVLPAWGGLNALPIWGGSSCAAHPLNGSLADDVARDSVMSLCAFCAARALAA